MQYHLLPPLRVSQIVIALSQAVLDAPVSPVHGPSLSRPPRAPSLPPPCPRRRLRQRRGKPPAQPVYHGSTHHLLDSTGRRAQTPVHPPKARTQADAVIPPRSLLCQAGTVAKAVGSRDLTDQHRRASGARRPEGRRLGGSTTRAARSIAGAASRGRPATGRSNGVVEQSAACGWPLSCRGRRDASAEAELLGVDRRGSVPIVSPVMAPIRQSL